MASTLSAHQLGNMQCEQHVHDMRNHFDILALHKNDRLKHYGLHYSKYVGRLARGKAEPKPLVRTVVDALLIALSAANTLHQDIRKVNIPTEFATGDLFAVFADAAGRFADACEKIDHMEEFLPIAKSANIDIFGWILATAGQHDIDLADSVALRRKELSERAFYITEQ
jgi:hypothetical protein